MFVGDSPASRSVFLADRQGLGANWLALVGCDDW